MSSDSHFNILATKDVAEFSQQNPKYTPSSFFCTPTVFNSNKNNKTDLQM